VSTRENTVGARQTIGNETQSLASRFPTQVSNFVSGYSLRGINNNA
jgi:hypothetical protein